MTYENYKLLDYSSASQSMLRANVLRKIINHKIYISFIQIKRQNNFDFINNN